MAALMVDIFAAVITKDHRELEQYYNEIINNPNDHDHQDRYGNQFVWELTRHSVGEELIVYPAFEKYLGAEGKSMAESDRKEHHEVCSSRVFNESEVRGRKLTDFDVPGQGTSKGIPKHESRRPRLHTQTQRDLDPSHQTHERRRRKGHARS